MSAAAMVALRATAIQRKAIASAVITPLTANNSPRIPEGMSLYNCHEIAVKPATNTIPKPMLARSARRCSALKTGLRNPDDGVRSGRVFGGRDGGGRCATGSGVAVI